MISRRSWTTWSSWGLIPDFTGSKTIAVILERKRESAFAFGQIFGQ